ncbi:G-PROTEIN-RECEP-F1-2 domain-containing protein [Aphelenchoides fujianensis]|nr:G-PROTEIN-RECEP-F1-2 domain-containing protein [Aphelenchoides fujianensis]
MWRKYKGTGAHVEIYTPAILLFCLMLAGYVGNSLVIAATWKNKSLQGSCNIFISIACFADILHQSSHWVYLFVVLTGRNFIPLADCLYFNTIPQIGVSLSISMTFLVGVDRLVSILVPTLYRRVHVKTYVVASVGITLLVAAFFLHASYSFAWSKEGRKTEVICVIIDSFGRPENAGMWFLLCVSINVLDLLVYGVCWFLIRTHAPQTNDANNRVFKSLLVLMLLIAAGWLVNAFVMGIYVSLAAVPVSQHYFFATYFGLLPNLASAANVIPLWIFSHEYRRTFKRLLIPFCPCLQRTKLLQVHTMTVAHTGEHSKSGGNIAS